MIVDLHHWPRCATRSDLGLTSGFGLRLGHKRGSTGRLSHRGQKVSQLATVAIICRVSSRL